MFDTEKFVNSVELIISYIESFTVKLTHLLLFCFQPTVVLEIGS